MKRFINVLETLGLNQHFAFSNTSDFKLPKVARKCVKLAYYCISVVYTTVYFIFKICDKMH